MINLEVDSPPVTSMPSYKLTIDINLMRVSNLSQAIVTLKRWEQENKVLLMEVEPARDWTGSTGKPKVAKQTSTVITLNGVASLLFPSKDPRKLSMTELNSTIHLIKHYQSKNEIFVTANSRDFLENGRRDKLLGSYGIVAMTPEEAVETLRKMGGWE